MDWLIETDCLKGQYGGSILSILPFRFYGSMRSWGVWEAQPGHSQVKQIQQILVLLLLEHCPSAIHWWEGVTPNSDFYWPFEPKEQNANNKRTMTLSNIYWFTKLGNMDNSF